MKRGGHRSSALWKDASVLVIDDHEANVMLLTRILETLGVSEVHGVTDPRDAVDTFDRVRPDLVLLDLHMPHLDGFGVINALGQRITGDDFVPVVMLTADSSHEARERALSIGAKDFITKPLSPSEVMLRVANLLETRALYCGLRRHNAELAGQLMARDADEEQRNMLHREREARVREAFEPGNLTSVFQPIVELRTGAVVGVEALSRFAAEPIRPPDVWFDEASSIGLGTQLEMHAVRTALAHLPALPDTMFMSVNMSPEAAADAEMVEIVTSGDTPRIMVEITEHTRISDPKRLIAALDQMRAAGVRVAVDDTGAGFAGLQQILDIHPEVIKLDMALTHDIDADPVRRALASCLLAFANEIGALIVAEGIETGAELSVLRGLGVSLGQGYFLARPGDVSTISDQIASAAFDPVLGL